MANTTLIASVTGIAVSGVVGPTLTAWAARRSNRQQFERDQAARRRADLRDLIDEAAVLLGAGGSNLRIAREAAQAGRDHPGDVRSWARDVHLLKQRLLLRLPSDHKVLRQYEEVVAALEAIDGTEAHDLHVALRNFEDARERFLDLSRAALGAPITKA